MKRIIVLLSLAGIVLATSGVYAEQKSVPNVLTFQSMLFDDGGNLIADGPVNVTFRITDSSDSILYEEKQTVDAVRGQVSAIVGGGLDANGAPTGGIPLLALDPASPRYLTVEVDGMPATSALEIASVPYAIYAGQALGAAKGAIDSAAIADGGIAYEDLGTDLIAKLASSLTGGRGAAGDMLVKSDLETMYRDPSSASSIGVKPGFVYSSANDLQGVLTDLDRAVTRREERIVAEADARAKAFSDEAKARQQEDTNLQTNINNEVSARQAADNDLQTKINNEVSARQAADNDLQTKINTASSSVTTHASSDISVAHPTGYLPISRLGDDWGKPVDIATQYELNGVTVAVSAADTAHEATPHVKAWGSISNCDTSFPTHFGGNIDSVQYPTMGHGEASGCWITFTTPMPSTSYIVVGLDAGCAALDKSTTSFRIPTTTISCGSFDFIAIGN